MLHAVDRVNGRILWANMHLLFWLSLVPFATAWMGENHFASLPTALYGVVLLLAADRLHDPASRSSRIRVPHSKLRAAIGNDKKGKISMAALRRRDSAGVRAPLISWAIFVTVALIWLAPDRRIEDKIESGALRG